MQPLRWLFTLWIGTGCAPDPGPASNPGVDSASTDPGSTDSGAETDGADGQDGGTDGTDGDTGSPWNPCPEGMAAVPPTAPTVCVDAYEASANADSAATVAGAVPLVGESFDAARARCAATPAVTPDGVDLGPKHLVTLEEWRLAAGDGVFPTGDDWPADTCAVLTAEGETQVSALQATGSFPDCVSDSGVYDQLGNAWEWVDPVLTLDRAGFLAAQADRGLSLSLSGDQLVVTAGDPGSLSLEIAGLQGRVGEAGGAIVATDVTFQADEPFTYAGYLIHREGESESHADWMLPVEVLREGGVATADQAPLVVRLGEDGQPVTAKVGCAWYTGTAAGCRTRDRFFGHPHDFDGTIGLRCAVAL